MEQMLEALATIPTRRVLLNDAQREIIEYADGPLWIIAGPGSGKTEVLVLRCLKLILVDGVDPRSILMTTFTEKAARNLQDRIANYKMSIAKVYPEIAKVDLFQLRVGTLHSLCNDIMIDTHYAGYKNYRPLDDLEQLMFIYFNSSLVRKGRLDLDEADKRLWKKFDFVWASKGKGEYYQKEGWLPSRWMRARACQLIFNRIVEDYLDIDKMQAGEEAMGMMADAYTEYRTSLENSFRVDFPHMQSKFLQFLDTPLGKEFVQGGREQPGISYVLVDEYQDTNPIQEAIYVRLANRKPYNICVVGDDDQALYRFRGGTVECMINFGEVCKREFGVEAKPISLVENYRSHPVIVQWINDYIQSFDSMKKPGARAANKPPLLPKSKIKGNWPAVALLNGSTVKELARKFGDTIAELISRRIVSCPSDCVLLLRSTRETPKYAREFASALRERDVPVYNPRSRRFLQQDEIMLALGAFLEVVDADREYSMVPPNTCKQCDKWRTFFESESPKHKELAEYVRKAQKKIASLAEKETIESSVQDIVYHILNLPPFARCLEDPEKTVRLGQLTGLFEAFSSSPIPEHPGVSRGFLRATRNGGKKISWQWKRQFYDSFATLVIEEGLNDPEDEEVIYPVDMMPIMTVHQAKGLEFPFVFVTKLDDTNQPSREHIMEDKFKLFRRSVVNLPSAEDRARQDLIRFFFVAYSRAKYALVLMTTDKKIIPGEQENAFVAFGGKDVKWFRKRVKTL